MTTHEKAVSAYMEMCEKNMIPKSQSDELLFVSGYMKGKIDALDDRIESLTKIVGALK